ncbi:MAG: hypothetical protein KI792_10320 [Alphaproteobacteria bacterium]|nr:hypothetical protein [Alphaproteobacteria bacterium SS10]
MTNLAANDQGKMGAMKPKKKGRKKRKLTPTQIMLGLSTIAAAMAFYPTTMILVPGMLPTIVAFYSDTESKKLGAVTVGCMNMVGVSAVLMDLWIRGHGYDLALFLITDPVNWLIMYSTAAVGWLIFYGIPALYSYLSVSSAQRRLEQLRRNRADLLKEWGADLNRIEVERRETREALKEAQRVREQANEAAAA